MTVAGGATVVSLPMQEWQGKGLLGERFCSQRHRPNQNGAIPSNVLADDL